MSAAAEAGVELRGPLRRGRYKGPVKILPRPDAYPGRSVWGKTQGPVAFLGNVEQATDRHPGIAVFVTEGEQRQLTLAWGWPTPEEYEELEEKVAELRAEVASLTAALELARENQVQVVPIQELGAIVNAARQPVLHREPNATAE